MQEGYKLQREEFELVTTILLSNNNPSCCLFYPSYLLLSFHFHIIKNRKTVNEDTVRLVSYVDIYVDIAAANITNI